MVDGLRPAWRTGKKEGPPGVFWDLLKVLISHLEEGSEGTSLMLTGKTKLGEPVHTSNRRAATCREPGWRNGPRGT